MPDVYLSPADKRRADADLWEQTARGRLADAWAERSRLRLPNLLEEAQAKLRNIVSPPPLEQPAAPTPQTVAAPRQFTPSSFAHAYETPPEAGAGVAGQQAAFQPPTSDLSGIVRAAAQKYGIDPEVALRVAQSEGGLSEPARPGDSGSSFGPFQLHYGNVAAGGNAVAGMGDEFTRQTGLDARDPANAAAAIDFALKNAAQGGWTPFHGAARAGIGAMEGIGGQQAAATPESPGGTGGLPAARTSQFGLGLSDADAYAACGPAAAIAFANTFGRNPTAAEALTLAKKYGWTAAQGMAGIESEQKLLSEGLGIPTKLERDIDWNHVARDASTGNPVIVSTPGHYFYVSGYNPQDDTYNVGTSGTDLRGGSAWMTADQMQARMGAAQGALYSDNPKSPVDSIAKGVGDFFSGVGSAIREISPESGAAREIAGQDQLSREYAAQGGLELERELTDLAIRKDNGEQGLQPRMDAIGAELNRIQGIGAQSTAQDAIRRQQAAAERNPELPGLETGANIAGTIAAAPLSVAGAPLAGRVAAEILQPGSNAPALLGAAREAVAPARTAEQQLTRLPGNAIVPIRQQVEREGTDLLAAMAQELQRRGHDTTAIQQVIDDMDAVAAARRAIAPGARAAGESGLAPPATQWTGALKAKAPAAPTVAAPAARVTAPAESTTPRWLGDILAEQRRAAAPPPAPPPGSPERLDWLQGKGKWAPPPAEGSIADKAIALRYLGLLGNHFTQIGNILGNTGQAFVQPTRLAVSGHPGEAGGFLRGMAEGIPAAIASFSDILAKGAPVTARKTQFARRGAFGTGKVGRAVDFTGDFMAAADQFFQTIALSGYVRGEAVRQAGGDAALAARLVANPRPPTLQAAQEFAKTVVYNENPGAIVNWLSNRAGLSGGERLAVTFLMPFLRVTSNITMRGLKFAAKPVTGPISAVGHLAKGETRAASLDLADTALSGMVLAAFASKAINGELSGEGPTDPGERRLLVSQGWQPHSIRVGQRWYDYSWAGPIAVPAGLVANMYEFSAEQKSGYPGDEQVNDLAGRMSKALLRQTYLSNIGALFDDRGGGAVGVLQNAIATTLVPNLVRDIEQATDPYERKPPPGLVGGTLGRIAERAPGLSGLVPAEQDVLGRPLPSRRAGFQPLRSSEVHPDALINAFGAANLNISPPRDRITVGPGGSKTLQLKVTPEESRQWNAYRGEMLQRLAGSFVPSPGFDTLPLPVRQKVLRQLLDGASRYATAKLIPQVASNRADFSARLQEAVNYKIHPPEGGWQNQ